MSKRLKHAHKIPVIKGLYSNGMKIKEIASALDIPYNSTMKYIRELLDEGGIQPHIKIGLGTEVRHHMEEWERVRQEPKIWWTIDPAVTGQGQPEDETAKWWREHRAEWDAACAIGHKVLVQMAVEKEAAAIC